MKSINLKTFEIILLSLFFSLLLFSSVSAEEENVLFEKTFNVTAGEKLNVSVSSADIEVKTWNRDEVHILVMGEGSVSKIFDFNFAYNNGVVSIVSKKKSDTNIWNNIDDLEVKVMLPLSFDVELNTSGGDVEIEDLKGRMEIATSGGDIEIDNSEGSLTAKTSGGDIEVSRFNGDSILKTSGGDIEAKRIVGDVEAKTSGGDVELFVAEGKVEAVTSGGDVTLEYKGENMGIELKTSGGDIEVLLPSDFAADVLLKSSSNGIDNNFKATKITEITKSKFEGKYNDGGNKFIAKTLGGSITVNQK